MAPSNYKPRNSCRKSPNSSLGGRGLSGAVRLACLLETECLLLFCGDDSGCVSHWDGKDVLPVTELNLWFCGLRTICKNRPATRTQLLRTLPNATISRLAILPTQLSRLGRCCLCSVLCAGRRSLTHPSTSSPLREQEYPASLVVSCPRHARAWGQRPNGRCGGSNTENACNSSSACKGSANWQL